MANPTPLVTLPRIEAWLESLPPSDVVYPRSGYSQGCVVRRYLWANGFPEALAYCERWVETLCGPAHLYSDPKLREAIGRFDEAADEGDVSAAWALTLLRAVKEAAQ